MKKRPNKKPDKIDRILIRYEEARANYAVKTLLRILGIRTED